MEVIISVFIVMLYLLGESVRGAGKRPPHIVVFLADDMGWNDVGYHNNQVKSPTLDRLAREGVKLENYYAKSVCTPSRGELLTGRNAAWTGLSLPYMQGMPMALPLNETLLPQRLKERGYRTHMVGKWHIGHYTWKNTPLYRGFDSFYGIFGAANDYFTHTECLSTFGQCGLDLWNGTQPDWTKNGTFATYIYTDVAKDIIKKHDADKPLFLYVAFQLVHEPLKVPKKYEELYDGVLPEGVRKIYLGMVSALDEAVSEVMGSLAQQGMLDNTVIVFSSDNGGAPDVGADNGPYRGIKGSLWEGGIKVPAFVWSKLLQKPGRTVRDLITITDWCPTLLGLAGVQVEGVEAMDGFDVWDVLSKDHRGTRVEIIHELVSPPSFIPRRGRGLYNDTFDTSLRASLRQGDWKIITGTPAFLLAYTEDGEPVGLDIIGVDPNIQNVSLNKNVWLYNITKDPYEVNDVADKNPGVVRHLLDRLEAIRQMAPSTMFPPPDPALYSKFHNGAWAPVDVPDKIT